MRVKNIPVSSIIFDDAERQRSIDEDNVTQLMDSILRLKQLLQPIIVEPQGDKYILRAGRHRLEVFRRLERDKIPAALVGTLTPDDAMLIEWEENFRRKQLHWKEECVVFLKLHELKQQEFGDGDEGWTVEKTGAFFGVTRFQAQYRIFVAKAMRDGIATVLAAENLSTAYNAAQRAHNRGIERQVSSVLIAFEHGDTPPEEISEEDVGEPRIQLADADVHQADFNEWALEYAGPKFHFIHLDPPYGIKHARSAQGGSHRFSTYKDLPEDFLQFLDTLCYNLPRLADRQTHVMLWLTPSRLSFTKTYLEEHVDGLRWGGSALGEDPVPLIWFKSDSTGIIPDSERGGRRVYETAIAFSLGDRKVIQPVNNCFPYPGRKGSASRHLSEKPREMLQHFFRMFVDEHTNFLDPCTGSGTSLWAAHKCGASGITGLDEDPEHVDAARTMLNLARFSD